MTTVSVAFLSERIGALFLPPPSNTTIHSIPGYNSMNQAAHFSGNFKAKPHAAPAHRCYIILHIDNAPKVTHFACAHICIFHAVNYHRSAARARARTHSNGSDWQASTYFRLYICNCAVMLGFCISISTQ